MKHSTPQISTARSEVRRRGAALIMAIMLVAVMGIGAGAVWSYLHVTLKQGQRTENDAVAQCLAEAGLDKAIAELRAKRPYTGEKDTWLDGGRFAVEVTRGAGPGDYVLRATGERGTENHLWARCVLQADLSFGPDGTVTQYRWHVERRAS